MSVLPPRTAWPRLLTAPSSYLLLAVAVVTVAVKVFIARDLAVSTSWPLLATWAGGADVATYLGFAALFTAGEGRFPWIRVITWPLAAVMVFLGLVNAGYLWVTGEQLSWETVDLGTARFSDFWSIVREHLQRYGWALVGAIAAAAVGLPVLIGALLPRVDARRAGRERAVCAAALAAIGLVVALALPRPSEPPARQLGGNAVLQTYWSWATAAEVDPTAAFDGYSSPRLVSDAEITRLARGGGANVVLFILESTRFDHTSMSGPGSPARTPNLLALARAGASARAARAVVPHTTKSLFTILCSRYPVMQRPVIEASGKWPTQCLPAILAAAGYQTALFQSAKGSFESRDRYAQVLGYGTFAAAEQLGGEAVGYLASSDESLSAPVIDFIDRAAARPFFVTVLTSATHHPYRMPETVATRAVLSGAPRQSAEDRYSRLVEAEDELIGSVVRALAERHLGERTLIVVVGDHGEGFGVHGVRQHDNNFFEEGLHVPFVLSGPGVAPRELADNISLLDLAPTLLGRLGVSVLPAAAGVDVLSGSIPRDRPLLFNCWQEPNCRGFVLGTTKVVHVPLSGDVFAYDLAADPAETHAGPVAPALLEILATVEKTIVAHQAREGDLVGW